MPSESGSAFAASSAAAIGGCGFNAKRLDNAGISKRRANTIQDRQQASTLQVGPTRPRSRTAKA